MSLCSPHHSFANSFECTARWTTGPSSPHLHRAVTYGWFEQNVERSGRRKLWIASGFSWRTILHNCLTELFQSQGIGCRWTTPWVCMMLFAICFALFVADSHQYMHDSLLSCINQYERIYHTFNLHAWN